MVEETVIAPNVTSVRPTVRDYAVPIGLIALVLLVDQIIKIWIKTTMLPGEEIHVAGNWFILHFTENNGIAFGTEFGGRPGKLVLTLFRMAAAAGIFWYMLKLIRHRVSRGLIISIALIFAGATGNIIDSIFYGVAFADINNYEGGIFFGKVVDMFYFPIIEGVWPTWVPSVGGQPFTFFEPVFNFADAAITAGVLLIILFFRKSLGGDDKKTEKVQEA